MEVVHFGEEVEIYLPFYNYFGGYEIEQIQLNLEIKSERNDNVLVFTYHKADVSKRLTSEMSVNDMYLKVYGKTKAEIKKEAERKTIESTVYLIQ